MTESSRPEHLQPKRGKPVLPWLIIVAVVVLLLWTGMRPKPSAEKSPAENLQLQIVGRQTVGFSALFGAFLPAGTEQEQSRKLLRQLEGQVRGAADQIAVIPVVAELRGAEAALERLVRIETTSTELREDIESLGTIYTVGPTALESAKRERLHDHYKWFGQLALAWNQKPDDPTRRAALSAAKRTMIGLAAIVSAASLGVVGGLVLTIVAVILIIKGRLRSHYSADADGRPFLEAFAIYLAWLVGLGLFGRWFFPQRSMFDFWTLIVALAPLAFVWPLLRGVSVAQLRSGLGWHRGSGWASEIRAGILGYIAGLPLVALGFMATSYLSRSAGIQPTHPIANEVSFEFWRVAGLLLLASVYAPLAEETMFRGAFHHGIRRVFGPVFATLTVSLIFAAIHPQGWSAIPALMSVAIVLAILREWRGSLIAPITAHALNNGLMVTLLVMVAG